MLTIGHGQSWWGGAAKADRVILWAAQQAMALVSQGCKVFEEGPYLVVEMRMYITDPNSRLAYVHAIANSDVILNGSAKHLFLRPVGEEDRPGQHPERDTLGGLTSDSTCSPQGRPPDRPSLGFKYLAPWSREGIWRKLRNICGKNSRKNLSPHTRMKG